MSKLILNDYQNLFLIHQACCKQIKSNLICRGVTYLSIDQFDFAKWNCEWILFESLMKIDVKWIVYTFSVPSPFLDFAETIAINKNSANIYFIFCVVCKYIKKIYEIKLNDNLRKLKKKYNRRKIRGFFNKLCKKISVILPRNLDYYLANYTSFFGVNFQKNSRFFTRRWLTNNLQIIDSNISTIIQIVWSVIVKKKNVLLKQTSDFVFKKDWEIREWSSWRREDITQSCIKFSKS